MAISICDVHTDSSGKDKTNYGSIAFPIACYLDDLTKMMVNLHWHDEFEFIYVTEGNIYVQVENQKFLMEENSSILINMNILHSVEKGTKEKSTLRSLVFNSSIIADSPESVFWQKYIQPFKNSRNIDFIYLDGQLDWHKTLIKLMDSAWEKMAAEDDDYENQVRFNITSAFHLLLSKNQIKSDSSTSSQKQILRKIQIKKLLTYINENYTKEITLEDLSKQCDISESSCLRLFNEFTKKTPIQYIKQLRIEKANELLKSTDLSITEIALSVGFNDVSYFIKSYKEIFGKTPKEGKDK